MNTTTAPKPLTDEELTNIKTTVQEFLTEDAKASASPDRSTIQKSTTRISYEYLARILATIAQPQAENAKLTTLLTSIRHMVSPESQIGQLIRAYDNE